jgi:hypothetical protein
MNDPNKSFGGIYILLVGDFVLLPVTTGRDLWSVMYGIVSGNNTNAQNLFLKFQVYKLTANMQSAGCETHMRQVAAFWVLLSIYPSEKNGVRKTMHGTHPSPKTLLKALHMNSHQKISNKIQIGLQNQCVL